MLGGIAYIGLGLICVGLGVLGAFLPVLPTTPFLLVALWAFSLSSKRLETWLLQHRRFGPRLRAWRAHRVVPLPVKLTAWGSMIGSLTVMGVAGASRLALGGAASVMLVGAVYVARCPSRPPSPGPHDGDADVKQPRVVGHEVRRRRPRRADLGQQRPPRRRSATRSRATRRGTARRPGARRSSTSAGSRRSTETTSWWRPSSMPPITGAETKPALDDRAARLRDPVAGRRADRERPPAASQHAHLAARARGCRSRACLIGSSVPFACTSTRSSTPRRAATASSGSGARRAARRARAPDDLRTEQPLGLARRARCRVVRYVEYEPHAATQRGSASDLRSFTRLAVRQDRAAHLVVGAPVQVRGCLRARRSRSSGCSAVLSQWHST